jgi:F-type H+-transporting ATPase subunit delta
MARRYAVALADVVTKQGEAREVKEELAQWVELLAGNNELLEVVRNPTIPYLQKRRVLGALLDRTRPRPSTTNFLQVLLQNQRLADLAEIYNQFSRELDRRTGVVTAKVTTARPVDDSARERLRTRLTDLTKSQVRLEFGVDETLIGGVVTRIGSTVYDGSVRTQLEQVKKQMAGD